MGEKGKPKIISIKDFPKLYKKDPTNDKLLVQEFGKIFQEAEIHVAHFGQYFDMPYLNSRRMYHGLCPMPKVKLADTWRLAKTYLKLNSNRLATVAAFLGLDEKTPVTGPHWIKAMSGNKKSLAYVEKHCSIDVVVLEQVYDKLRQFQAPFPIYSLAGVCPHCGSTKTHKRGHQLSNSQRFQRYHCCDCGLWSRDSKRYKA